MSVRWLPPTLGPSGAGLGSRHEDFSPSQNAPRGLRPTGAAALSRLRAWRKSGTATGCRGCARAASVGHHPTAQLLLGQGARPPLPPGSRFVDTEELFALGLELPTQLVAIARARAARAPDNNCGLPVLGHRRDRARLLMDIHSHEKGASLCRGCPPLMNFDEQDR